jgi:hypothetical protein
MNVAELVHPVLEKQININFKKESTDSAIPIYIVLNVQKFLSQAALNFYAVDTILPRNTVPFSEQS